ncbi:hypothetical protein V8C26DRAFT_89256 [Trichoderma gracile]
MAVHRPNIDPRTRPRPGCQKAAAWDEANCGARAEVAAVIVRRKTGKRKKGNNNHKIRKNEAAPSRRYKGFQPRFSLFCCPLLLSSNCPPLQSPALDRVRKNRRGRWTRQIAAIVSLVLAFRRGAGSASRPGEAESSLGRRVEEATAAEGWTDRRHHVQRPAKSRLAPGLAFQDLFTVYLTSSAAPGYDANVTIQTMERPEA